MCKRCPLIRRIKYFLHCDNEFLERFHSLALNVYFLFDFLFRNSNRNYFSWLLLLSSYVQIYIISVYIYTNKKGTGLATHPDSILTQEPKPLCHTLTWLDTEPSNIAFA